MVKKYAVYPGYVQSKYDGDVHYISAGRLMHLYKVNPSECIIIRDEEYRQDYNPAYVDGLIKLYPDYHGNYKIPEKEAV